MYMGSLMVSHGLRGMDIKWHKFIIYMSIINVLLCYYFKYGIDKLYFLAYAVVASV